LPGTRHEPLGLRLVLVNLDQVAADLLGIQPSYHKPIASRIDHKRGWQKSEKAREIRDERIRPPSLAEEQETIDLCIETLATAAGHRFARSATGLTRILDLAARVG
jgi:hypothetical protein